METLTKIEDIQQMILSDKTFTDILACYKNDHTKGFAINFNKTVNNGLIERYYGIEIKDKLSVILMPIFSSEKTITWNFSYYKIIKETLPKEYSDLTEAEITDMVCCVLYYFDKHTNDVQFLTVVRLKDWLANGSKGKNGFSVYYWNDKLPNHDALTKRDIKSDILVRTLPSMTEIQIKKLCSTWAEKKFQKYQPGARTSKQIIKNITDGLYAEIKMYLYLNNEGHEVTMNWTDADDKGIDIQIKLNDQWINIDVKSTHDEYLKISKIRKETDFYAVCQYTKGGVDFLGMLFKYDFWASKVLDTTNPEKDGDMYKRKLTKTYMKNFIPIDKMFEKYNTYKKLKTKRVAETLFNVE